MVPVGARIKETIDYMSKGEIFQALTPICIALDITSKRRAGATRSGRALFKRFITQNMWLITYVGFPGLMVSTVRVPFAHPDIVQDCAGTVGIEEIIYHVIRCGSVHSDGSDSKISWNNHIALGMNEKEELVLSTSLIWGLVCAVVFAPENASEDIPEDYWLQVGQFKMFVSELWGREDLAKRVVKFHTGVQVQ